MASESPGLKNFLQNEYANKNIIQVLKGRDLKLYTRPATSWESACEAEANH